MCLYIYSYEIWATPHIMNTCCLLKIKVKFWQPSPACRRRAPMCIPTYIIMLYVALIIYMKHSARSPSSLISVQCIRRYIWLLRTSNELLLLPGLGHTYINCLPCATIYGTYINILYIAATTASKRSLAVYLLGAPIRLIACVRCDRYTSYITTSSLYFYLRISILLLRNIVNFSLNYPCHTTIARKRGVCVISF